MSTQEKNAGIWMAIREQFVGSFLDIVGFSFCLIWVFVASHSLAISISVVLIHDLSARFILLSGTAFGAFFLLVFAKRKLAPGKRETGIASGFMSVGFLLYAVPDTLNVPAPVSMICIFLSGFGYGVLFLAWLSRVAAGEPKRAFVFFGLSIFLAALADAIVISLPIYLVLAVMLCLPPISMILCAHTSNKWNRRKKAVLGHRVLLVSHTESRRGMIVALVLPLVVEGFAYGAFTQLVFYLNANLENTVGIYALSITAALLLLSAALYSWLIKRKILMFAFFIMLAVGYSCIPLFSTDIQLVIFVLMLSYNFFYFLVLSLCEEFIKRINASFLVCSAVVVLSFSGGDALGSLFAGGFAEWIQPVSFSLIMSNAVVYSFLLAAFVAIQFFFTEQEKLKPVDELSDPIGESFALSHGLSQREIDVFALLMRGRTAGVIAEKLFISVETVRAHIKSIYKKTTVHSQQELIDEIEAFAKKQKQQKSKAEN